MLMQWRYRTVTGCILEVAWINMKSHTVISGLEITVWDRVLLLLHV